MITHKKEEYLGEGIGNNMCFKDVLKNKLGWSISKVELCETQD